MEFQTIKGESVTSLGLGTWRLSGEECAGIVENALSVGYRHIDTAEMYGNEEYVGEGIEKSGVDRGDIFLATKVWSNHLSHKDVLRVADDSLRKLDTEYLDLFMIHWPGSTPLGETLGAMGELKEAGKIKHIGVSNFSASLMEKASEHAEISCNQVPYSPYDDQSELLEQAGKMDYLLTAYSPIAKGRVAKDPTLEEIGKNHGKTPVQITLRWLVQQNKVAAIPKASSEERLKANLDISDFELSEEEMGRVYALAR
ncbi:MAG: aldo/keto reductase [Rubrobacter sp.]|nr:aldo/keto reductase [Rubrobacter sp.]